MSPVYNWLGHFQGCMSSQFVLKLKQLSSYQDKVEYKVTLICARLYLAKGWGQYKCSMFFLSKWLL